MDSEFSAPFNFLGLEEARSAAATSPFVILPVPYEQTTSYGCGTRGGPDAILQASRQVELWDDELGFEPADAGIHTLPALQSCASGPRDMVERIRGTVAELDAGGQTPILLGGEHTVSVGAVQAMAENRSSLVTVLLDAHADLRSEYQDSPFSHACTARRISEECPIVEVGVRSLSREEAVLLTEKRWTLSLIHI